jgi:hypothetical protein
MKSKQLLLSALTCISVGASLYIMQTFFGSAPRVGNQPGFNTTPSPVSQPINGDSNADQVVQGSSSITGEPVLPVGKLAGNSKQEPKVEIFDFGNEVRIASTSTDPKKKRDAVLLSVMCLDYEKTREGSERAAQKFPMAPEAHSKLRRNLESLGKSCQTMAPHDHALAKHILIAGAEAGDFGMAALAYSKGALGKEASLSPSLISYIFNDASRGDERSITMATRLEPPKDFNKETYLAFHIKVLVEGLKPNDLSFEDAAVIAKNHKYLIGTSFTDAQTAAAIALAKVPTEKPPR